jgi:hypothetical protein
MIAVYQFVFKLHHSGQHRTDNLGVKPKFDYNAVF